MRVVGSIRDKQLKRRDQKRSEEIKRDKKISEEMRNEIVDSLLSL